MVDFAKLKNNRKAQFDKLAEAASKVTSAGKPSGDDRFWSPTIDKAGNGTAIIRFLPAPAGEDVPFVRYWDHGFQGPGGWYIENSLTSIGQDDPVSEFNSKLWNSGREADKEIARKQKRRLHYVSNIFVVSDPGNPDNDGKVFLFKYGKKIFDMINSLMHPEFADEDAVNPFDLWDGANFRLRIRNVEGYRNYDKSTFDSSTPLHSDDEVLEKIWNSQHKLQSFLDASNFKSYAELKAKLVRVLGTVDVGGSVAEDKPKVEEDLPWSPPEAESKPQKTVDAVPSETFEDDDESLAFFRDLANS
jgi:hypothetical protein